MTEERYNFAKLNINGDIFNNNFEEIKNESIPNFIQQFEDDDCKTIFRENKRTIWTFKDIKRINNDVIYGNLVVQSQKPNLGVEGSHTYKTRSTDANNASFYYYIDEEVIAFHTRRGINVQRFITNFQNVFNQCENSTIFLGDIRVILLTEKDKVIESLLNNKISKFTLNYIAPNNPKTDNEIEKILQNTESKTGKVQLENKDGLKTTENNKLTDTMQDFTKIVDYGWADFQATSINGDKIDSSDHPMSLNIKDTQDKNVELRKKVSEIVKSREENGKHK